MATRSKAQVYSRAPAEIVGLNPTRGMDVCLLWVLCVVRYRSLRRTDHSSGGVLPTVVRRVCSRNREKRRLKPAKGLWIQTHDGLWCREKKKYTNLTIYQKGAYYLGIKIPNYLPIHIKNVANEIQVFIKPLKRSVLDNSFYSTDEYFNANKGYTFLIVMISWCNWYFIV